MSEQINRSLERMVKELSAEEQAEVRDFVEFLLSRHRTVPTRAPRFDWAGALRDMRDQYTSVELQHEISRLRSEPE